VPFVIRKGVPDVERIWEDLETRLKAGTLDADERIFLKRLVKAAHHLSQNPRHPGLQSHEIDDLSRRAKVKVWCSYLQNNAPAAGRIFWCYGPGQDEITIVGIEPHPEDRKSRGYERVTLSAMPREKKKPAAEQPKTKKPGKRKK
jgi:hypothetical protein